MKTILRTILINSFALYLTSLVFKGLIIQDPLASAIIGGVILTVMNLTVRPILSVLALPFNILTLGSFSWIINIFIVYLLTLLAPAIQVTEFTFAGANLYGVIIPTIEFTKLTATIAISFLLTLVTNFILWLISWSKTLCVSVEVLEQ